MTTSDTTPYPGPPADGDASGLDRFFDWLRGLDVRRDTEDKWLAGVCSGVATRLGVDPVVVRAGLILLVLLGGLGFTVYLVAWAFIPNDREEIIAERAIRQGEVLPIILLVVIGLSLFGGTGLVHDSPGLVWFWWLVLPVGVVVWLVTRHRGSAQPGPAQTAPAQTAPAQTMFPATTAATYPATTAATYPAAPYAAPGYAPADSPTPPPPGPPTPPAPPASPAARPRPPRPPRPPRAPRRRSAGFLGAVLVSGLALAAYGLALWVHDNAHAAGSGETVALAVALAVVGAAVLGIGLMGRRAGLTGFIAIVLALTTWTASVVPHLSFGGGVGDRVWRPSTVDTASRYRLGIGQGELDLTALPTDTTTPRRIEAGIGIGELRVRIPSDLTVEVRSSVGAGDISRVDPSRFDSGPTNPRGGRDLSTTETFGSGSPDVVVTAHVGLGQILIGQE